MTSGLQLCWQNPCHWFWSVLPPTETRVLHLLLRKPTPWRGHPECAQAPRVVATNCPFPARQPRTQSVRHTRCLSAQTLTVTPSHTPSEQHPRICPSEGEVPSGLWKDKLRVQGLNPAALQTPGGPERSSLGTDPWWLRRQLLPPGDSCLSTLIITVPGARLTPVSLQGVEQAEPERGKLNNSI